MTTVTATSPSTGIAGSATRSTTGHPIRRATLVSGAAAAVATTAVAAAADGAGVPFAIDGETIPLLGFAQMTALGAVIGGVLAAALRRSGRRSWFLGVTAVLTVLSCVPSVAMPPDTATKLVLVGTHLLAAAIIVPSLVRHLGDR